RLSARNRTAHTAQYLLLHAGLYGVGWRFSVLLASALYRPCTLPWLAVNPAAIRHNFLGSCHDQLLFRRLLRGATRSYLLLSCRRNVVRGCRTSSTYQCYSQCSAFI